MGTKADPGKHDCYARAEADEPLFALLARDASAPELVERWARYRNEAIFRGEKPESDCELVIEAIALAKTMRAWRAKNRP